MQISSHSSSDAIKKSGHTVSKSGQRDKKAKSGTVPPKAGQLIPMDQFCESVVCMRDTLVVGIVNRCMQSFIAAEQGMRRVDCGMWKGGCSVSSMDCTVHVAPKDKLGHVCYAEHTTHVNEYGWCGM